MMTEPLSPSALAMTRPVAVLGRAGLAHAVAMATLTVDRKNTLPILSNLRLSGDGESLSVIGTDLDIEIRVIVPGAADSRLDVTVPAHMLKDILSKAKDSELASLDQVEHEDSFRCGVDLGGVKFNLNALPATDFPVLEPVGADGPTTDFEVESSVLTDMLAKTSFAISTEETRYYLNGIFLHVWRGSGHDEFRAVATDGHRLAVMAIPAPDGSLGMPYSGGADSGPGAIVPRKTVKLLLDIIKAESKAAGGKLAPVTVSVAGARIVFCVGSVTVTSKLIDGTFPDYERVVPRYGKGTASVGVKAMRDAVIQVGLISGSEKGRAVKLEFEPTTVRVTASNPDAGFSETVVECGSSVSMDIGFNSKYLIELLDEICGDSAFVTMSDSGSPAVWTDPGDARFKAVLMPMRV